MDVLDSADGHFLHNDIPHAGGHADLGVGIANYRTQGIPLGANHAGYALLSRLAGKCLHSSYVVRVDRPFALVCHAPVDMLDLHRDEMGMIIRKDRFMPIVVMAFTLQV